MTIKPLARIGALDISEAISSRIGSYVHAEFIEFLTVDGDVIQCWYMNSGGKGPSYEVNLRREGAGWLLSLVEHPPGTEQTVELP